MSKRYRKGLMDRATNVGRWRHNLWYIIFTIFLLWFLFLYLFYSSTIIENKDHVTFFRENIDTPLNVLVDNVTDTIDADQVKIIEETKDGDDDDSVNEEVEVEVDNNVTKPVDIFLKMRNWTNIADEILTSYNKVDRRSGQVTNRSRKRIDKMNQQNKRQRLKPVVEKNKKQPLKPETERLVEKKLVEPDPVHCKGKYVFVYRIPRRYNDDLIRHCRGLSQWTDMCAYASNMGLGPRLENVGKVYSNTGWFSTDQFLLEVIFHNRMKQYKCLTTNSSLASAIFVPFYAGLDLNRYLWSASTMKRKDEETFSLMKWLKQKPEWKRYSGRDHFMVAGRISWDFRRDSNNDFDWGNKLLLLPETKNMTMLVIESSPWHTNDFAIPYPTYFHPSTDEEVFKWQNRMRNQRRSYLFSFVGGSRPNLPDSIRSEIMNQCRSSKKCSLIECVKVKGLNKCYQPEYIMSVFQSSVFCLQPAGDSFTRRSTFDSIIAGCIPVFFNPGSAYVQYIWHLPKNYSRYSVFIPDTETRNKSSIERTLEKFTKQQIEGMREEVIKLIPKVIYANPDGKLETLEDAFDITVKGVLRRIQRIKQEMEVGKRNLSTDVAGEDAWKYNLFGTLEEHEWDHFFERPRIY